MMDIDLNDTVKGSCIELRNAVLNVIADTFRQKRDEY